MATKHEACAADELPFAPAADLEQEVLWLREQAALLAIQSRVLESLSSKAPLVEVLTRLTCCVEEAIEGSVCSILLYDERTGRLHYGIAPSIPDSLKRLLDDGLTIGPDRGACGSAAFRRETVITEDIATDPLWNDFREPTLQHGLRACWSTPVLSSQGKILGTFGTYYRVPRAPSDFHLRLLKTCGHLAALAIERKQEEERLHISETRLRGMLERVPGSLWTTDRDLRITFCAGGALQAMRINAADLVGMTIPDYVNSVDPNATAIEAHYRALAGESVVYDLLWCGRNLKCRVEPYRDSLGELQGCIGFCFDITEQKQAEASLARTQGLFRQMADTVDEVFWLVDPHQPAVLYVSPAYEKITGRTIESLQANPPSFLEMVHPDDCNLVELLHRDQPEGEPATVVFRIFRPDGEVRWIHDSIYPILDENGELVRITGVARDITERRQAELELERSRRRLADAQRLSRLGHWEWNLEKNEVLWSEEVYHLLGLPNDGRPRARTHLDLVHPEDRARVEAAVDECFLTREPYSIEFRVVRPDGAVRTILERGELTIEDPGERRLVLSGTLQDVTDRRTLEDQLRQSQKMDAVGRLAGGIAHDFNNLLTIIIGYADILSETMPAGAAAFENLMEIRKAADRAGSLTRQLLAFSRKQFITPRIVDLNQIVLDMEKMLKRLIGEDIELVTVPSPHPGLVFADPGQLEQVILNLIVNARDAMPSGGRLTIGTGRHVETRDQGGHDRLREEFVVLAVEDTGTGMTEEVKSHLFEPFYTTKEAGKGTGMGLATVYGIVSQSGGRILVRSEPGNGTTFSILLPLREGQSARSADSAQSPQAVRGNGTVLLVEDEGPLRFYVRSVLTGRGYYVLEAANGQQALQLARAYDGPIELLLTDVVMPLLTGPAIADELLRDRPDLKVLYISGYTDDAVNACSGARAHGTLLQKPFTAQSLVHEVQRALDVRR